MSYTPTEWKAGDVVTSAKLNKIEQGIVASESSVFIVTFDRTLDHTDKTAQEIEEAYLAGKKVILRIEAIDEGTGYSLEALTSMRKVISDENISYDVYFGNNYLRAAYWNDDFYLRFDD